MRLLQEIEKIVSTGHPQTNGVFGENLVSYLP